MGKKPQIRKVGIVSIRRDVTPKTGQSFFELRFIDPSSGREVKRRVADAPWENIREMAEGLSREAYSGRGYLKRKSGVPAIEPGFAECLRCTNTRDHVRAERARLCALFVKWLAERFPAVKDWGQLRPAMVQAYAIELERREPKNRPGETLAFDTVRLSLAPIKLAWRHMAENYPGDVRPLPKIKLAPSPPREIECLDAREVAALLGWLKEKAPDLWPVACLQALVGLRTLEAINLRREDIDLDRGLVTITATGAHRPKTANSYRVLPICDDARAALAIAIERQKVIPPDGGLFLNKEGNPWTKDALTWRWHRLRPKAALATKCPRVEKVPGRKLRASFATMAGLLGVGDRALKRYLGHAPEDVLGAHYRKITVEELREVSGRMNNWRSLFAAPESRKEDGEIEAGGTANG